jgi:hypothetical protein
MKYLRPRLTAFMRNGKSFSVNGATCKAISKYLIFVATIVVYAVAADALVQELCYWIFA